MDTHNAEEDHLVCFQWPTRARERIQSEEAEKDDLKATQAPNRYRDRAIRQTDSIEASKLAAPDQSRKVSSTTVTRR
jgi:hypothetical protein